MDQRKPAEGRAESPALWLLRVIQGVLIGGGAILPGISGGVLSVVFGIYRPMMEFLSHPFATFKKNIRLFIPIIIGVAVGLWGFAKLIAMLFAKDSPYPISLFVGLIVGTLPMLWRTAGRKGRGKAGWLSLSVSFFALLAMLLFMDSVSEMDMALTVPWTFISGIIWGFSLVVPGLSSSSILLSMGLYQKIMDGVSDINLAVIVPLVAGIAVVAFFCARFVNWLFDRYETAASHAVVGLVTASTLMIWPWQFASLHEALLCRFVAAVGFVVAYSMDKWGEKIKPADE